MAVRTIHLIMGQSNARGAAAKADLTDNTYNFTQPDVRQWTRLDGVFAGTASAAVSIPSGQFSIEAPFGFLAHQAGEMPCIFRAAGNGYSLKTTWNPDAATAEWADSLVNLWACYEAAKTEFAGDTLEFGSLIWIQGEADAQDPAWTADYESELVTLGTLFRGEFGANMPIIFVQLSENFDPSGGLLPGALATMRAAYVSAAGTLGNCAVVDATPIPLQADDVHYTANGLMTLGENVYAAYAALVAGTQNTVQARAFTTLLAAQTFADACQLALGDRDENPADGGFGQRLGTDCRDPWPVTPRDEAVEKHPTQNVWYMPVDGPMAADGGLDTTTDARPVDLSWLRAA
jgi:Carbohydrate esterase, sialic acid-specific acetylesterase